MRRRRARQFKAAYPVQPGAQPVQNQQQGYQQNSGYNPGQYEQNAGQYPPQSQAPPGCESLALLSFVQ